LQLLIDHREKTQVAVLDGVCERVAMAQLPIGDYLIVADDGAVVVERKTVNDFLSSIRSNRLWDQLLRMMKTDELLGHHVRRRMLVVCGSFEDYFETLHQDAERAPQVPWSQLMGAFMEVVYVYNTPVFYVENTAAFHAFMRILVKRESAGQNDKLPDARWFVKPVRADLPVKDRKRYILAALPYIGDRLAANLLAHFKTISHVACASVNDLRKVPMIGKKKAALIYELFQT
jgi:ERCC4-type nuclease